MSCFFEGEFATRSKSFEFAEAACLQYLEKHLDYFEAPSLGAQDAFLKKRPSPAATIGDEGQAPPAASAVAYDVKDDDN